MEPNKLIAPFLDTVTNASEGSAKKARKKDKYRKRERMRCRTKSRGEEFFFLEVERRGMLESFSWREGMSNNELQANKVASSELLELLRPVAEIQLEESCSSAT
jgi:hypothetical protein